jgi:hypothetical protein
MSNTPLRAHRRRQLRAAGLLPFSALQRQVLALDDVDDKEII